ncbi:metal-binding protein ZinT [Alkalicoccus luteus]|uniref:metal-binding protein ZinT n=1 Tax=Alkalicoccus luteus TaxID=1237094 RepID=UPI004033C20F
MKRTTMILSFAALLTAAGCQSANNEGTENASAEQSEHQAEENENHDQANETNHHNEEDHNDHDHNHDDNHDHNHDDEHDHHHDEEDQDIYDGYFEDDQIEDRDLSDWEGEWQSVYPYLQNGELDDVMEHKADEDESMTAEEYIAYYETGYQTDVDEIIIEEDTFTFLTEDTEMSASYDYDGYEVLTYEAGNRGVRFIFEKQDGDSDMPAFIQFSDHQIAPNPAHHFHLYWGEDRDELLDEVTNWPTYYPASMDGDDIAHEMIAH